MHDRPQRPFRPLLERLETLQLPSTTQIIGATPILPGTFQTDSSKAFAFASAPTIALPPISFDRVTNPVKDNAQFKPPFGHVLVQAQQPVAGQTYNVQFLSVYNGTADTFTASNGLMVRTTLTPQRQSFPILTGNEVWKPGGRIVFYILTKKYYPFATAQSGGFQVNFATPRATGIPGPSGIGLRIKYNAATFLSQLDYLVTSGPGSYGHQFGLPDTAIWWIVPDSGKIVHL